MTFITTYLHTSLSVPNYKQTLIYSFLVDLQFLCVIYFRNAVKGFRLRKGLNPINVLGTRANPSHVLSVEQLVNHVSLSSLISLHILLPFAALFVISHFRVCPHGDNMLRGSTGEQPCYSYICYRAICLLLNCYYHLIYLFSL